MITFCLRRVLSVRRPGNPSKKCIVGIFLKASLKHAPNT